MQARWGTHGDHPIIVLTPASVPEIHSQTIKAFELSERLRIPVVVLYDEILGHLVETVDLSAAGDATVVERRWAQGPVESYQPYAPDEDGIPIMARPGDGYRTHTTGLTHDAHGFPTQEPARVAKIMERLLGKTARHRDAIEQWQALNCDDADVLVVAYGISARAAVRAVSDARARGIAAGLFRPITLWPFPERALLQAARRARAVLVPELNAGQLRLEIERLCAHGPAVHGLNRLDGEPIAPQQILGEIEKLAGHQAHVRRVADGHGGAPR
jgi:2-oxoglutarate ferredoxin oxidoreductase subunit alpha